MRFNALDGFRVGALCCPAGLAGCKSGYFGLPESGIGGNGGLVTRDGPADAESKYPDEFAECGIVVLGDNVSASTDSRDRWSSRLRASAVKGVVLESANPLEELLKQRWRTSDGSNALPLE